MKQSRKRMVGKVTSSKMDKTVMVSVASSKRHPLYGKVVHVEKRYMAHDAANSCQEGDVVEIIESRPMSKRKRWAVVSIVEAINPQVDES